MVYGNKHLCLQISHGKIGNKLGKQTILILHTIGRKTGQDHAIPIAYFNYKDRYLIVASNWGKEKQADCVPQSNTQSTRQARNQWTNPPGCGT